MSASSLIEIMPVLARGSAARGSRSASAGRCLRRSRRCSRTSASARRRPRSRSRSAGQLGDGDLAAHRGRRLLAAAVPGAERAEDVVEAHDARLEAVVLAVVRAEPLGDQLLPAVGVLRRRPGRRPPRFSGVDVGLVLQVLGVDAGRRGVEVAVARRSTRAASRVWMLIRMLLCRIWAWWLEMKPMPPMSAASA